MNVTAWLHRLGAPERFYRWSSRLGRIMVWLAVVFITAGLVGGLFWAPTDFRQGESYRIIFVHVPTAWLSLFGYLFMAACAAIALIWRLKVGEAMARAAAPVGASFTALALITGSLWGKPMWGTWWVWDARLTSELLLLLLYFGFMALDSAFEDRRQGARAAAVLALVGSVNVPIIHYSVEWWNTLHQGPTITQFDAPAIDIRMLLPLLSMALGFMAYFFAVVLLRARSEMLAREAGSGWARRLVGATDNDD